MYPNTWAGTSFFVQNFEFQFFVGFQKNEIFWYEDIVDIFQLSLYWTSLRDHVYAF